MEQLNSYLAAQRKIAEEHLLHQNESSRHRTRERDSDRRDKNRDRRSRSPQRHRGDDPPTPTIKIRDLPSSISEREIRHVLDDANVQYSSLRLVKDRKTGQSKGFAFVEFFSTEEAKAWMKKTNGETEIRGYCSRLAYAVARDIDDDRRSDVSSRDSSWYTDDATDTIMLRGIPLMLSEREIRTALEEARVNYTDVRLIRDRRTGQPRGFGFVEFGKVQEAKDWMESQQGVFYVHHNELRMLYSSPRGSGGSGDMGGRLLLSTALGGAPADRSLGLGDWNCSRCGTHNFKRRDYCFKCHLSRFDNMSVIESSDGSDHVGTNPCNTLILQNLDALSTEENISTAHLAFTGVQPKRCRVMRDDVANVSLCYALVELNSVAEAVDMIDVRLKESPMFEIDGKVVTVNYAKNTYSTILAAIETQAQQKMVNQEQAATVQSQMEALAAAGYAAVQQYPVNTSSYLVGQGGTYAAPGQAVSTVLNYSATANAAAAVAQAALQHKQAQQQIAAAIVQSLHHGQRPSAAAGAALQQHHQASRHSQPSKPYDFATASFTRYPPPDTSTYSYEESSGYYYDPLTGLYYDAKSQYFYDPKSKQYVYWDQDRATYLPPSSLSTADQGLDDEANRETEVQKKDKEKKDKVKTAKKIAKDMEKWAKMMNAKKEGNFSATTATFVREKPQMETIGTGSKTADTGFAMLEAAATYPVAKAMSGPPGPVSGLVAQYGGDSDNEEPEDIIPISLEKDPESRLAEEEAKMVDWSKKACLLCSRGFKDAETLQKHCAISDLHKKNLEALRAKLGISGNGGSMGVPGPMDSPQSLGSSGGASAAFKMQYRDRAKERRDKYGIPSPPRSARSRGATSSASTNSRREEEEEPYVEPPVALEPPPNPTGESNVGNRLMQKMGWQAGQGLGRANQGRTEIVEPEFRQVGVGLGAPGAQSRGPPGENYKENVKRAMFARYHDME